MDASPSLVFHHVSFPKALEALRKAEQYAFLKTYCMQVLKLHVFLWMLERFITSPSLFPFSSPVAQDIIFNTFLLGLITLTFLIFWNLSFDVHCEMSGFPNEYIKDFVHSFMDVLWRKMRERHLEN